MALANKVIYFSVDGSAVQPRRTVVALQSANCNRCHAQLSEHGSLRNNTEYCVLCHNPSNTDASTRPSGPAAQKNLPNQGIAFDLLVHRIHTGNNLPALGSGYTVVGFGGSINDFTTAEFQFPAMSPQGNVQDTRNCLMCHSTDTTTGSTAFNLPLGKNAVTDPQGPINPDPAITAACTGCHAALSTASHAMANTTALGESCLACHATGPQVPGGSQGFNTLGLDYAVDKVHAQY